MKPVFVAAPLLAAWALFAPTVAFAQEPEPAPVRKPTPAVAEPSPTQSTAREVAVRRNDAPRAEKRAESPRGDTPVSEATRIAPAPSASSSEDQGGRRGAVRRPPSDGGGRSGEGQSQAPRDRAVARTSPPPRDYDRDRGRDRVYYYPSYYSYGRYYDPYYYGGFHLGYLAYSPWGWTPAFYGYPYAYTGYGAGYGYGYGYGGHGYDYGALRIKVKPRDAEVYVDGYFAGNVDDFDGVFQSLKLEAGGYKVEIRKPGFETLTFDVHVQPDRTITWRGDMRATP